MQNRIEELARKARAFATTRDAFEGYIVHFDDEKFEQKFAELLIEECAFVVRKNAIIDDEGCYYSRKINEHFGIKE